MTFCFKIYIKDIATIGGACSLNYSLLIEKIIKKFEVCDCFLEIACYCWLSMLIFVSFQKRALCILTNTAEVFAYFLLRTHSRSDNVFFIKNTLQFNRRPFCMSYVFYFQDFIDFQIDLFMICFRWDLWTVEAVRLGSSKVSTLTIEICAGVTVTTTVAMTIMLNL